MMFTTKKKRVTFLAAYVLLATLLVLFLKPYYFFSLLIVLMPPSLINFYWIKDQTARKSILLFSLVSLALFAPPVELSTRLANVWDVQSIFPRPFGLIPLENMLFAFFNFFWGLSFYVYFSSSVVKKLRKSVRFKYLVTLYLLLNVLIYGLFFLNPALIKTSYAVMAVTILILPMGIIFARYPKLYKKTVLPTLFFAFVFFVYEIISLEIESWWWPGSYLYSFNFNGHVFPLDDVVIWYFLSTPALIAGFEYFANDYGMMESA